MANKEKPIIFSMLMVEALLNTKPNTWPAEPIDSKKPFKSMTRRVIKPQPEFIELSARWKWPIVKSKRRGCESVCTASQEWWEYLLPEQMPCKEGDILWVKETHRPVIRTDMSFGEYYVGGYIYKTEPRKDISCFIHERDKWTPSIFMPREASRILLKVKSVRAEQIQDISEDDAYAEGCINHECELSISEREHCKFAVCRACERQTKKGSFSRLWDMINGKRGYSWENNPWVWVYEFMRIK